MSGILCLDTPLQRDTTVLIKRWNIFSPNPWIWAAVQSVLVKKQTWHTQKPDKHLYGGCAFSSCWELWDHHGKKLRLAWWQSLMEKKWDALADRAPTSRHLSEGILDHPVPAKPQMIASVWVSPGKSSRRTTQIWAQISSPWNHGWFLRSQVLGALLHSKDKLIGMAKLAGVLQEHKQKISFLRSILKIS